MIFIMNSLFVVAEAIRRLVTLAGENLEMVLRCFQRVIDDPVYRRQVWLAMTGKLIVNEMSKDEWIERETNAMIQLGLMDAVVEENDALRIKQMATKGQFGINHYFIPSGLTRSRLLELAAKVGIKLNSSPNCDGDEIPTEAGMLECDLSTIMQSTDSAHRPFNLDYNGHLAWAKEQGGSDLTSAEEMLYLLIRHSMAFGRILFMGGWIRCRNRRGSGFRLLVSFDAGDGLRISYGFVGYSSWGWGAVPWKFTPLGA
ncbi:MAG: hypothetical protein V1807_00080 [Patescibacteria group bacterium]